MEAERECAKALKLVEEKEEEMEYHIKQLEGLREKNSMLRTQLDMEQQCKEAEVGEDSMPSPLNFFQPVKKKYHECALFSKIYAKILSGLTMHVFYPFSDGCDTEIARTKYESAQL